MPATPNQINIYLVDNNSAFAGELKKLYRLSKSSKTKLSKRPSSLAIKSFITSRTLPFHILATDWLALGSNFKLDDSTTPPTLIGNSPLYLSISHSGDYVAAVIAQNPVAVDLELVKHERNYLELAKRAFHQNEIKIIENSTSKKALKENFYKAWTLRECFYKLGMLESLTDQEFDSDIRLREGALTPYSYINNNIYLSLISTKPSKIELLRFD